MWPILATFFLALCALLDRVVWWLRLKATLQPAKQEQARIALGSVAPTPVRAYLAETILQSNPINADVINDAAQAAQQAASPISDLRANSGYRSKMVAVLTRRALEMVCKEFASGNGNE